MSGGKHALYSELGSESAPRPDPSLDGENLAWDETAGEFVAGTGGGGGGGVPGEFRTVTYDFDYTLTALTQHTVGAIQPGERLVIADVYAPTAWTNTAMTGTGLVFAALGTPGDPQFIMQPPMDVDYVNPDGLKTGRATAPLDLIAYVDSGGSAINIVLTIDDGGGIDPVTTTGTGRVLLVFLVGAP
jgi:hypothetical protein